MKRSGELAILKELVPTSITPKTGWRAWSVQNDRLVSGNGTIWTPRAPLEASCKQQPSPLTELWLQSHTRGTRVFWDPDNGENFVPYGRDSRIYVPKNTPVETLIPVNNCACGIYAATQPQEAFQYARGYQNGVIGRVALWGKVIVHHSGYRAEFAYPQALYFRGADQELGKTIKELYGITALSADDLPKEIALETEQGPTNFFPMTYPAIYGSMGIYPANPIQSGYATQLMLNKAVQNTLTPDNVQTIAQDVERKKKWIHWK